MENKEISHIDNSLKLIAKSSFVVLLMLFISKILVYIYRVIVARYYGAEIYGMITLTLVVSGMAVTLASLGIPQGIIKFIPEYRAKRQNKKVKYILKKISMLLIVTSILASVVLFIFSDFIAIRFFENENLGIFLKIFSFIIPFWVFSNVFMTTLAALEKVEWSSFLNNVVLNVVKVSVLVTLIILGLKGEAVVLSYASGFIILFFFSYFVFNKYTKIYFKEKVSENKYQSVFKVFYAYSWPLILSGIISQIFYWADSLIIGYYLNVEDVGVYNAAVPLALLLSFAPEVFTKLFFPLINKEFSRKNIKTTKEVSQQVGKWIFMVNFPLLIIILAFSEQIITFVFGSEYIVAANSLRILAIGSFVLAQSNISEKLILITGKSRIILKNIMITVIIGILLDIFLVQKIGIVGAALSTSLMYLFLSGLLIKGARKSTGGIIPIRRKVLRIIAVSFIIFIGLGVVKMFISLNLISAIITSIIVLISYALLIVLTKCLDKNDIMILKTIQKNILKRKNNFFKK